MGTSCFGLRSPVCGIFAFWRYLIVREEAGSRGVDAQGVHHRPLLLACLISIHPPSKTERIVLPSVWGLSAQCVGTFGDSPVWGDLRRYLIVKEEAFSGRVDAQGVHHRPPLLTRRLAQGAGFGVQGSGFRVWGSGLGGQGSGCRVWSAGLGVHRFSPVAWLRVQGSEFGVQG